MTIEMFNFQKLIIRGEWIFKIKCQFPMRYKLGPRVVYECTLPAIG